ncbi:MAG: Gfo/Idh/MocA family oxidoreductase [Terriglobia bacterium]
MIRIKGAAMGAGYFSRFQYEAWSRIPEVEMAAVCDLNEEKARPLMAQYGIARYYADWREMIDGERPDFVDIVTPPETHEEMCAYAASRGIHIICQKPLAPTLEASRRIVATARAAGVRFMVHENWRWQPWYREMKRIQGSGTVGDFTHIHFLMRMGDGWGENAYLDRQPFFRDYPRLLVYETGVHFIDTFRYLLGRITEVYAHLRRLNPVIQGEETGQVFFRFANGATAIWDANRYNEVESPSPRYTFGQMRIDATGGHITLDTEANLRIKPLGQSGCDLEYPHRNVNFGGDCVYALQRHFVDSMLTGGAFEANGDDYLETLAVVEAVYESARRGEVVRL